MVSWNPRLRAIRPKTQETDRLFIAVRTTIKAEAVNRAQLIVPGTVLIVPGTIRVCKCCNNKRLRRRFGFAREPHVFARVMRATNRTATVSTELDPEEPGLPKLEAQDDRLFRQRDALLPVPGNGDVEPINGEDRVAIIQRSAGHVGIADLSDLYVA